MLTLDRDLVRLNTANPPGNEAQVANYMRDRLAPLGFETDVIQTPTPGKAHLIARLRSANPVGKPVVLCAHADTVGVERELWSVDPFAGTISGDFLYGRGSFDDKGGIAVFAAAAMRLARAQVPLTRDIVLVFEADEEGGDYGIDWLAENHWDKLDAAYSLNEGGIISTEGGEPEPGGGHRARQDLASRSRFRRAACPRTPPDRSRRARSTGSRGRWRGSAGTAASRSSRA